MSIFGIRHGEILRRAWRGYQRRGGLGLVREVLRRLEMTGWLSRPGLVCLDYYIDFAGMGSDGPREKMPTEGLTPSFREITLLPYRYSLRYMRGKSVLEVGCNWGYGAALFAEVATEVVAFDYDATAIRYGEEHYSKPNLHFLVHDANNPFPLEDDSFDVVYSCEVLEHIANYEGCVCEMHRVLKPNGLLVLKTPNVRHDPEWHAKNPYHLKVFNGSELRSLLKRYFVDVDIRGYRDVYSHEVIRIYNPESEQPREFGERIPLSYKFEIAAWVQPILQPINDSDASMQAFLVTARKPSADRRSSSCRAGETL